MKNEDSWRPTKFVRHRTSWRGSRDQRELSLASRVTGDLQAAAYGDALATYAHGDLVDLGCGHVPAYAMYREHVDTVTCVDWPNSPHPSPHLDLEADLTDPLPFPDEAYDTVVLTDVLEHLPYPDGLVGEIARVLRPAGVLVLGVPFMYGLHEQPHDHHRYTEHRLRLFCTDHDLEVVELYPYGRHDAVALDLTAKLLASSRLTRPVAALPAAVASMRRPSRTTTPLPLGYVLVARKPAARPDPSAG
ncbi:class I SAM-dependent methyltransferase [Cellulomonas sp. URHD0024]|uniref:class I SAM-dependent methyltransferase n=1 Tax=Cellulomonas sp. URHD0024 TaxID=1302620 RepID=UPI0006858152|nr:class I SAM-dependent methyltransferase [Cellulomonas sp. URHD0024]